MVGENTIISVEEKSFEALQSEILIQVRDCTFSWAKGGGPVRKRDINPGDMPKCLPHVSLIERLSNGPKKFLIRLAGEEITNRTLGYVTGGFIEDVTPGFYRQSMLKFYGMAIDQGKQVAQNITWNYDYRLLGIERFMVPVIMPGQQDPSALLVATVRGRETLDYMAKERRFSRFGSEE